MWRSQLGHVLVEAFDSYASYFLAFGCIYAVFALLTARHLSVKADSPNRKARWSVLFGLVPLPVLAAVVLATAPTGSALQPVDGIAGMPDLISDRPFIWREQIEINPNDGALQRVLAFDGYLHNVGEGSLDLQGNPQIPGDVTQRVFDGERWDEVTSAATPTVRYETDDGHNHFHLIGVAEYALFEQSRRFKIDDSSKVGFCLVDTEQVEEVVDSFYPIDRYNYCNQDDPESTELRMGISPGWRDTYDANTTLQWVDVSDVEPGTYWIGAITDPNNEVVESNEDNNGLVYSVNTFPVAGYIPTSPYAPQQIDGPQTPVHLQTESVGLVGTPSFTITSGPKNGTLDVPLNVALSTNVVHYTPDDGFVGEDEFEWQVRDTSRPFPREPKIHTSYVMVPDAVAVSPSNNTAGDAPEYPTEIFGAVPPATTALMEHEYIEFSAPSTDLVTPNTLQWFATNLPPGLRIERATGLVSGAATARGSYESTLHAWDGDIAAIVASLSVPWTIASEQDEPGFRFMADTASRVGESVSIIAGRRHPEAVYEATGLPQGTNAVSNYPWIAGTPEEVGRFDITLFARVGDEVLSTTSFTWEVRPSPIPAFPL